MIDSPSFEGLNTITNVYASVTSKCTCFGVLHASHTSTCGTSGERRRASPPGHVKSFSTVFHRAQELDGGVGPSQPKTWRFRVSKRLFIFSLLQKLHFPHFVGSPFVTSSNRWPENKWEFLHIHCNSFERRLDFTREMTVVPHGGIWQLRTQGIRSFGQPPKFVVSRVRAGNDVLRLCFWVRADV